MAVDLITAKRGVPHVSPRNDATIWRAMLGKDDGFFEYGGGCTPEEVSGQRKVKVDSGIGMIQGRMFMVTAETFDVPAVASSSGVRSDRICLKVTCDTETDTQSAELVYLQDSFNPPESGDLDSNEDAYLDIAFIRARNGSVVVSDLRGQIFSTQDAYENARYSEYIDVLYSFTASTGNDSFNHNLPIVPENMWTHTYDIVDMYAVSSDGQTRYPIPYIYNSSGVKYLAVLVNATQVTIQKNASWAGYTFHMIVGKKIH